MTQESKSKWRDSASKTYKIFIWNVALFYAACISSYKGSTTKDR